MNTLQKVARRATQVVFATLSLVLLLCSRALGADWHEIGGGVLLGDATSLVDMNAAMKVIFEDSVFDNTVHDSELLDQFEMDQQIQTEESTGGRYIETAQYFNLPAGVRSVRSGDYIPVPKGPVIENSRVYLKKIQGTVEMLGDTMRRVRSNEGAFLDWGKRALPDLVKRLTDTMDRVLIGFGAGILARVNQVTPSTSLVIDSGFGVTGYDGRPVLLFQDGEQIVFSANPDGDPLRDPTTPSAVVDDADVANNVLELSRLPAGVADDDYIFLGDDTQQAIQGSSGDDRDFMGLLGMVDDGSILPVFQEITRANFRKWRSLIFDATTDANGTGALDEDLITLADEETTILGGSKINLFVTSYAANRQYWRKLRADRSLNDPLAYTGGRSRTGIVLGDREIPIKVARKIPEQLAFGLDTKSFKRWQLGRYEWDDLTGSIWNRATDTVGRKDAYYAVGHLYIQMGCFAPRHNFRIEGIDKTVA